MTTSPDPMPRPLDHLALRGCDGDAALVLRAGTISWKDLRSRVAQMAAWLQGAVPAPGARVATWAAKGELTCLMPLAAARAGLVHVPVNPLLKRAQVRHILNDSGASLLIANAARLGSLAAGDLPQGCTALPEDVAASAWGALEAGLPPSSSDPHSLAAILYTSGSTGNPKGVMLSHANLWLGAVSVAHYLELAADDVTLAVLPLSFDYGQNQLLSTWYAGGSAVPLDYLTARDVIKACARHGVTTLAAVPPLWLQLVEQDWPADAVAPLRRLTNSGGALGEDLVRALRRRFPDARLFPMYGLTEAFRSTFLDPALVDTHPTSMGRAIPFAEILVVDEAGAEAGEGELVHCGPLVAQGYWQDAEKTARRFKPAPRASHHGGTAVWSGDTVRRDAEGLLYFVGREDAMIKSAGNRISPQEIEDAAIASGMAEEAVAFGLPDARLGEAIHLVVRGSGEEGVLREVLRRELPNFMQPATIRWIDAMPLNPNGKVDRARLRKDAE
ncbi:acyl-CoA ligase (AMP-forming), exosortase A system-associated [Erythrobacter arachoides]|uniref:Acyl-CoA ligase (AMP-forming), exosortase A system-associated n=1 Tax=Aurantiacibacter arachoides TaxID=1850444 RepID=A0A845A0M8_9SPHN|nr:acyl-CoA ligase (AMP-forming), exosortase A system-associated [Aurantiacibacter arachoides]MXO93032.1 acyl-CoA ligase (AMP-forming), exosortase A system-associated [Aurantiacibacter arachoides]GGD52539.1 AMP-binding protein [Aurantiacibacter arachoides]